METQATKQLNTKQQLVILVMRHNFVDNEYASPNLVAAYASNMGIELTSDEVVETSFHYELQPTTQPKGDK